MSIDYKSNFWEQVDKQGACWRWLGTITAKGYGSFYAREGKYRFYRAHRYSWFLEHGEIDSGLWVLHKCDNPWCVNPEHLWLGTNEDNMKDKIDKGRHRPGERHGMAKLTEKDVLYIRACGKPALELAAEFDVHGTTIYNILNGKKWRHLLPDYEPQPRWKAPAQRRQQG